MNSINLLVDLTNEQPIDKREVATLLSFTFDLLQRTPGIEHSLAEHSILLDRELPFDFSQLFTPFAFEYHVLELDGFEDVAPDQALASARDAQDRLLVSLKGYSGLGIRGQGLRLAVVTQLRDLLGLAEIVDAVVR